MVIDAHKFAKKRAQIKYNSNLDDKEIDLFCILDDEAKNVLDMAIQRFSLSFRAIKNIQKVARSIADLDSSEVITKQHILEAISYRKR